MDEYVRYEKDCKLRNEENKELLDLFEQDLRNKGLGEKTINKHLSNMDFFLNTYLLREDAYSFEEGLYRLDDFLGYFFIRKCMWSTPSNLKSYGASIKKFYKSMADHGKIEKDDYKELCQEMKDNMDDWQYECERYNNFDEDYGLF